jgi:hypothetical protein
MAVMNLDAIGPVYEIVTHRKMSTREQGLAAEAKFGSQNTFTAPSNISGASYSTASNGRRGLLGGLGPPNALALEKSHSRTLVSGLIRIFSGRTFP